MCQVGRITLQYSTLSTSKYLHFINVWINLRNGAEFKDESCFCHPGLLLLFVDYHVTLVPVIHLFMTKPISNNKESL